MSNVKPVPGTNGNQYIPLRSENRGRVCGIFHQGPVCAGLKKIYDRIQSRITGKTGIKLHTGEKEWPKHHSSSMGKRTDGR